MRALASHVSRVRHMWVEFVVGSLPCFKRFFSGYSGFPLSSKTNIFKLQFDLDYCQALNHEPLAPMIAQAFPCWTLNLHFTFTGKNLINHTQCNSVPYLYFNNLKLQRTV